MPSLKQLALIGMIAALAGCDSKTPDNQARDKMEQGRIAALSGDETGREKAVTLLNEAAGIQDASNGSLAQAKAVLGQVQYESGLEILRLANRKELAASQIALQIAALGAQLGNSATLVAGYKLRDPQAAQAKIKEKIDEATGSPDKPRWFTEEKITIASLTAAKQEVSRVQGEISKRQSEKQELETQRTALLEESEKASKAAEAAKGQESVDAYKQGSDARKKAADLQAQIDLLNGQLMPLEKDLKIVASQQQILEAAIKGLDDQSKMLDEGWKQVQSKIEAQKTLMTAISAAPDEATTQPTENASAAGKSIAVKAVLLAQTIKQADEARQQAKEKLDAAVMSFDEAFQKANLAGPEMDDMVNKQPGMAKIVEISKAVLAPQIYKLRVATAHRALADMQMGKAAGIAARMKLLEMLKPIMEKGEQKVPAELADDTLEKQLKESLAEADAGFNAAMEQLDNVTETRGGNDPIVQSTQKAGAIAKIFVLYGQEQLANLQGKPDEAKKFDEKARDAVKLAAEMQVSFPMLPGDLASAIPPPPPPPAPETPATAPTDTATADADPEVQAIRTVTATFFEALDKGDMEAAKAVSQIEAGQEELVNQLGAVIVEGKKFKAAVQEKMGDEAAALVRLPVPSREEIAALKVTVKGEEAFAPVVPGGPEKKSYAKVDGQWKVYVGAPSDSEKPMLEMLAKLTAALPQLTADVQAGKYATPADLGKAIAEALGIPMPGPAPTPPAEPAAPPAEPATPPAAAPAP